MYSNYTPAKIPYESLTHLNYAFANVFPENGTVYLTDAWADEQMRYTADADSPDPVDDGTPDNNLYGNLKRLNLLKRKNRNMKLILSIGGFTYSPNFWPTLSYSKNITNFAKSAVSIMENYGLDGLEIDWEYADTEEKAAAFVALLKKIRTELTKVEHRTGHGAKFQLIAALPAGDPKIAVLDIVGMNKYVQTYSVLSYDFAGSWSNTSSYGANLYAAPASPDSVTNVDSVMKQYVAKGAHPSSLVAGLPLYGRSFADTDGLGKPFNGVSNETADGTFKLKDLPQANAEVFEDFKVGASYSYDKDQRLLISFDTTKIFTEKREYIVDNAFGGVNYWELSGDYNSSSAYTPVVPQGAKEVSEVWLADVKR